MKLLNSIFLVLLLFEVQSANGAFDSSFYDLSDQAFKNGDYAKALAYNLSALRIAERNTDKFQHASALYQVGRVHYYLKERNSAISYFRQALSVAKGCGADSIIRKSLHGIGVVHYENDEKDSAFFYYELATPLFEKGGSIHDKVYFFGTVSESYLISRKDFKLSFKYLEKLRQIIDSTLEFKLLGYAYMKIGIYYRTLEDYNQAYSNLISALNYYIKSGYPEGQIYALQNLASVSSYLGDAKLTYRYWDFYRAQKEKIFSENAAEQLSKYQTIYETEKKDAEIEKKNIQISLHQTQILVISLIGLLVCLVFLILYLNYQSKQKIKRIEIRELERARIARDLHDHLGSNISYIITKVKSINNLENTNDLDQVKEAANQIMQSLRETIWALNKTEVTNIDLIERMKSFASKYLIVPYEVEAKIENEENLSVEVAMAIYRVFQEVITNINKHSRATFVNIHLLSSKVTLLNVKLVDNGVGFVPENDHEKYGIRNMEQRLREVKGKISIQSTLDVGTTVNLTYG